VSTPGNGHDPQPAATPPARRWATVITTADYLDVNPKTVRDMIDDGRLTAYRGYGARCLRLDLNEVDAGLTGK
jgi:excisionase family DNA binding protein